MNDYVEGRMGGRLVYWCPGGEGYTSFCPQAIDPDDFTHCCNQYWRGADMPTCCRYSYPTGVVYAFWLSGVVFLSMLVFLSCWFCYCCPLNRRLLDRVPDRR